MNIGLIIIQSVISLLLIAVILIQVKGAGLGSAFGANAAYARTRRGTEKVIFRATIVLAVAFVVLSLTNILAP